jgi:hypothetical protein
MNHPFANQSWLLPGSPAVEAILLLKIVGIPTVTK